MTHIVKLDEPPSVKVTRAGRWTYEVLLTDGFFEVDRWYVLGRKRADRKARRALARRQLQRQREADTWTIN